MAIEINYTFVPERPWPMPKREDCTFYHRAQYDDGEYIEEGMDLIGGFANYIGDYDVAGKTVLDMGTASGFLSFSAEEAGAAAVTAYEASSSREFERLGFAGSEFTENRKLWVEKDAIYLERLKNSFWYSWHKKKSKVEAVYAPVNALWHWDRKFDVVIAGAIVEHISDPVTFIQRAAGLASEALIIGFTEVEPSDDLKMVNANNMDNPTYNYTWWKLSRGLYERLLTNLGFDVRFVASTAKIHDVEATRTTIIATRKR